MQKYIFTIGLFDKDTETQLITTDFAKSRIADILISRHDIFAFTMIECAGYYRMNSTGRIVAEPSIRIEIASDDPISTDPIIADLKSDLNQESIMLEIATAEIYFM